MLTILPNVIEKIYGAEPFIIQTIEPVNSLNDIDISDTSVLELVPEDGVLIATIKKSGRTIITPTATDAWPISVLINKATLIAQADDQTRQQGKGNPEFTISYSGFKDGEDKSVLDVPPFAYCEIPLSSPPGRYVIGVDLKEASAVNYEFISRTGILEVTAGKLLPTAFTPNGDNVNDIWPWPDSGYKVEIFNRLGTLLYSGNDGWNGTYKNRLVEPGIYFYVSVSPDGDVQRGTVEVIRTR